MAELNIPPLNQEKRNAALYSVAAGVGLTLFKILVAISTGSLAVLAESAHSLLDLISALITYAAVRISAKPADESHNFGHGKIENFSALIEMVILMVTIGWILYEAVQRLFFRPVEINASVWAFLVMGVAIPVDYFRSRSLKSAAKKYDSQALEADALNYQNDMLSSTVTILGLGLVRLSQSFPSLHFLHNADAVAALGLVVIITIVSARMGKRAVDALLDRSPDIPIERIVQSLSAIPRVIDSHRVRLRKSGPDTFVDVHVTLDPQMPLIEVHQIMDKVETTIQALIPGADVDVHPEPAEENSSELAEENPPEPAEEIPPEPVEGNLPEPAEENPPDPPIIEN